MDCRKCGKDNIKVIETIEIRDDGSKHIKLACGECNAHIMFKQWQDNSAFIMPFGKFKGLTISKIVDQNKHYAEWAAENMKNNIGKRFADVLGLKKDGPKQYSMEPVKTNNSEAPF